MSDDKDALERLKEIGFRRVGRWQLVSGQPAYALDSDESSCDLLYAFVSGREVLYVGKTTQQLRVRMHGYQRPEASQRTNVAGQANLSKHLGSGRGVDIYILCDDGTVQRGSFRVSLAAGLEDAIIRGLSPAWNVVGKQAGQDLARLKWDAFAATFGDDEADTLRKHIARLPSAVNRDAVEQLLLSITIRREAWKRAGPARDRRAAVRALDEVLRRLERDFTKPLVSGLRREAKSFATWMEIQSRPGDPSGGRPRWRADAIGTLRELRVPPADAAKLADMVGLTGMQPTRRPKKPANRR